MADRIDRAPSTYRVGPSRPWQRHHQSGFALRSTTHFSSPYQHTQFKRSTHCHLARPIRLKADISPRRSGCTGSPNWLGGRLSQEIFMHWAALATP